MKKILHLSLALFLPIIIPTTAKAGDHFNLEEGLPIEVEDAYPIPYQGIEIQGQFLYERNHGKDFFGIEPRIEYGFAPNWQGRITLPFQYGSAVVDGIGDVGLELFYNFNTEGLHTPAFAVSVSADFPTSSESKGVDPTVKFIMTKTLGKGANLDRLHLNLAYTRNTDAGDDERNDRFTGVLGYSRRINSETILVTDFVYEQEEEKDTDTYLLEFGVRHQINPLTVLSIGTGVGLTDDSPDFRITFGFQRSL
ncbi:MAG: transporter [Moorea sp. SIO2B7]|nr:transporter [Moorena sp. SIO2B7]